MQMQLAVKLAPGMHGPVAQTPSIWMRMSGLCALVVVLMICAQFARLGAFPSLVEGFFTIKVSHFSDVATEVLTVQAAGNSSVFATTSYAPDGFRQLYFGR
jgi:hypothetical protein